MNEWITIYLMCKADYWRKLLTLGIEPFINKIHTDIIDAYYIELMHEKQYLKFAFRTSSESQDTVADNFIDSLNSIFEGTNTLQSNSDSEEMEIHIKYELSSAPYQTDIIDPTDFYFTTEVSNLIIEYFENELIDESMLLLLSLQLQICWIKSVKLTTSHEISTLILKGYFSSVNYTAETKHTLEMLDSVYLENELYLADLFSAIGNNSHPHYNDLPEWMGSWFQLCVNQINRNRILYKKALVLNEMTYYYIPYLLNKQLGLTSELRFTQNYLLTKLFCHRS